MASNRLMMMVAVIAGLLATALAFLYLTQTRASLEQEKTEPSEQVLVAVRDLAANTTLLPDEDLTIKEIPARTFSFLAGAAVNSAERNSLDGRRINAPIPAGTPLLYSHLTEIVDLKISPAARAMTVSVNESGSLGGLLVPGDRVDVVITSQYTPPQDTSQPAPIPSFDANNPDAAISAVLGQVMSQSIGQIANAEYISEVVVSNVKILAVGQKLSMSRQQFLLAPSERNSRSGGGAKTVTLEVTMEQALALASASAGGTGVTLLLRGQEQGETSRGFESGFR